jgi:hypothetical protein
MNDLTTKARRWLNNGRGASSEEEVADLAALLAEVRREASPMPSETGECPQPPGAPCFNQWRHMIGPGCKAKAARGPSATEETLALARKLASEMSSPPTPADALDSLRAAHDAAGLSGSTKHVDTLYRLAFPGSGRTSDVFRIEAGHVLDDVRRETIEACEAAHKAGLPFRSSDSSSVAIDDARVLASLRYAIDTWAGGLADVAKENIVSSVKRTLDNMATPFTRKDGGT